MPVGHHLVYFPPQVPLSQLLPDGTDTLHTPGDPFNRRLWAGGSVRFPGSPGPLLDGSRAVCIETIRRVVVKGVEGEEKVVVRIERRVGTVAEGEDEATTRSRIFRDVEDEPGDAAVVENRELVFMREKTPEQLVHDQQNFGRDRSLKRRIFDLVSTSYDTIHADCCSSSTTCIPPFTNAYPSIALPLLGLDVQRAFHPPGQALHPGSRGIHGFTRARAVDIDAATYSRPGAFEEVRTDYHGDRL